jgi:hypothetical protein
MRLLQLDDPLRRRRRGGPGPIDLHVTHRVWSVLVLTRWETRPELSCRPCASKRRTGNLLVSLVAGWWGFPWGSIITPIQIARNVLGHFRGPDPNIPSQALRNLIRTRIAANTGAVGQG